MGYSDRHLLFHTNCYTSPSFFKCKTKSTYKGSKLELQIEIENLYNENFISSYGNNYIVINDKKYFSNVILFKDNISSQNNVSSLFKEITIKNKIRLEKLNSFDFVLFGTGKKIEYLSANTCQFLKSENIPYEVMTSISAFKTYNILLSQGRKTLAFLKLDT